MEVAHCFQSDSIAIDKKFRCIYKDGDKKDLTKSKSLTLWKVDENCYDTATRSRGEMVKAGRVLVTLNYYENHQSFKMLCIDCLNHNNPNLAGSPSKTPIRSQGDMIHSVINEISSILAGEFPSSPTSNMLFSPSRDSPLKRDSSKIDRYGNVVENNSNQPSTPPRVSNGNSMKDVLMNCVENFKNFLSYPSDMLTQLFRNVKLSDEKAEYVEFPGIIPRHRIAHILKLFLKFLFENIAETPPITADMINREEKIYASVLQYNRDSNKGQIKYKPHSPTSDKQHSDLKEFTLSELVNFLTITALWYIQQILIAINLLRQFDISPLELDTIRGGFSLFDEDLSGDIKVDDLKYLLQDMGGDYSNAEIELIKKELDPDGTNSIEFVEFIKWWCE